MEISPLLQLTMEATLLMQCICLDFHLTLTAIILKLDF